MDTYSTLTKKAVLRTVLLLAFTIAACVGLSQVVYKLDMPLTITIGIVATVIILLAVLVAYYVVHYTMQPLAYLRQGILHVSSQTSRLPAPQVTDLHLGQELVTQLLRSVYDMASHTTQAVQAGQVSPEAVVIGGEAMLNATPLPVFTVAPNNTLHYINDAGLVFLGLQLTQRAQLSGKNINDILNLSFPNDTTYEAWIDQSRKNVLKSGMSWDRVRLIDADGNPTKQFDMAASYSKASQSVESVIVLFDHTDTYAKDDQEISFVAMAVHELRTPLTVMRGYIEVFEDELGPTLSPELKDFMHKMNASAQQLTSFVSNILNVARVEENALVLTLQRHNLKEIMTSAVADLEMRANVHGKHIELTIAADVPDVAVDRISLHEVINNLVDNAIKYSGTSDRILISAHLESDMVQVDVQDFGLGIPDSVVPKLFDKFYRSHRSKVQIGGTGLGLYLCKAIVTALGGNIWVRTKEGAGSTFSFTLEPYSDQKHGSAADPDGIMRGAHGWIKNHSMYRR